MGTGQRWPRPPRTSRDRSVFQNEDHPARHRHAHTFTEAGELRLSHRDRRRSHRHGSRPRVPPPADRVGHPGGGRHARLPEPSPLRPLHGVSAARPSAMGHGSRSHSRSAGVRPLATRPHDGAALLGGGRVRSRYPSARLASGQHRRLRSPRRDSAPAVARAAGARGACRRRGGDQSLEGDSRYGIPRAAVPGMPRVQGRERGGFRSSTPETAAGCPTT